MTNKYSLTYAGRIIAVVMAVSFMMGWDFDQGYITELVTALVWLVGEAASVYGRYRLGDLTWWGARK